MDGFQDFLPRALRFLDDLSAHNEREWFNANKSRYEADIKRPATLLLDEIEARLKRELKQDTRPKLYRIHRDVRFSKDKTPYNTHVHMQWSIGDVPVSYLFGASRAYCQMGVGAMMFPKDALTRWRENIAEGHPVAANVRKLKAEGWVSDEPALKRVPSPYAQNHPDADLLRRKGLVMWKHLDSQEQDHLPDALMSGFQTADAFRDTLVSALS